MSGAVERDQRPAAPNHTPAMEVARHMAGVHSKASVARGRFRDLTGERYFKVVVLALSTRRATNGTAYWICRCDCGKEFETATSNLKAGRQKSCGCYRADSMSARRKRHGHAATTGRRHSVEYGTWANMVRRCHDGSDPGYPNYGGRGIRVCDQWRSDYQAFLSYIGARPSRLHSIDRINNDGDYEPGNVRWALPDIQRKNQRPRARWDLVCVGRAQWAWDVISGFTGALVVITPAQSNTIVRLAQRLKTQRIFFLNWSERVGPEITEHFEAINFHCTDLRFSFGRGGAPIENLLLRGHDETVVAAHRMTDKFDAGPVYGVRGPVSLAGTKREIQRRFIEPVAELMRWIMETSPTPQAQVGEPVYFRRLSSDVCREFWAAREQEVS